jgi:hypothetical protein
LLPEVPCPPFYPIQEDHFNRTPCATDFLRIPIPCAVVGTQRILLAALPSPAPRSHLIHTLACIHRSIPPARLLALKHVYIMTLKPFRSNPCTLEPDFRLDGPLRATGRSVMAPLARCDAMSRRPFICKISRYLHSTLMPPVCRFPELRPYLHCYRSCVSPQVSTIPQRPQTAV